MTLLQKKPPGSEETDLSADFRRLVGWFNSHPLFLLVVLLIPALFVGTSSLFEMTFFGGRDHPPRAVQRERAVMRVFFGTDRSPRVIGEETIKFGSERGASTTLGVCLVSIPWNHRLGHLEQPSIWQLEFAPDSSKHVFLKNVRSLGAADFYEEMSADVQRSGRHSALVFVHGFGTTFEDAALRTGQMAFDLKYDGPAVMFSWPSNGKPDPISYGYDENNVDWAIPHLEEFLNKVCERTGVMHLDLVAHSMGNRALTRALNEIAERREGASRTTREVVLTAPDIDAEVFERDIAPRLITSDQHVTLYASASDHPLQLAGSYRRYPRAGDIGSRVVLVKGMDTIDATGLDTQFLGHSYFADNRSVLSDVYYLLRGERLPRCCMDSVETSKGRYWKLRL